MGLLEQMAADIAEIKAALAGGAAPAAEKAATKTKPVKAKEEKPAFTAEQLRDKFIEVQKKHGDAATKALIAELGFEKLAMLVADTANWQKCWDAAEAKLAEDVEGDDNGGL